MSQSCVDVERDGSIVLIHLNRPPVNAIDTPLAEELERVLAGLETEPPGAVILTGRGSCFSAGLDLKQFAGYSREDQDRLIQALNRMWLRLYGFPRPTIAAVNGHAIAGGMVNMLACDYRVGAEGNARFGLTEGQVGVAFPVSAKEIVLTELGPSAARRIMLEAATDGPKAALRDGALDELQPPQRVLHRAMEVAKRTAQLPRGSYVTIKQQIRGAALARIRRAVEENDDPLLGNWIGPEVPGAVARILGG